MGRKLTTPILLAGTPIHNSDLMYSTGFSAPDPVVYLRRGRQAWLVVNRMEAARARRTVRGVRVVTPEELSLPPEGRRRLGGWALGVLRLARVRAARVPADFPLGVARFLEAHRCRVAVEDAPLFPGRAVKTAAEIRHIIRAQQAAAAGIRAVARVLAEARADRRGRLRLNRAILTSEALRRIIHQTLLDYDCVGTDTIVAGGRASADPHQVGSGPLYAGTPIVVDIFPRHGASGYWGDITRTFCWGPPPERLERMWRAVRAAQAAVLAAVRPGASTAQLHQIAVRTLEARGFATGTVRGRAQGFIHGTGHGVGLAIHEAPSLGGADSRLKIGQVVTVEPGLYYPDIGGVRIEDTVVVTRAGYRILAAAPYRWVMAPQQ